MKKTKRTKKAVATFLVLMSFVLVTSDALAAWYSSTITLPRNGTWYTVTRVATADTQKTKVTNPSYDVVSHIAKSDESRLTSNTTHKANQTTTASHKSGVKGAKIKGAFRSSILNQKTNKVNLSWEP